MFLIEGYFSDLWNKSH